MFENDDAKYKNYYNDLQNLKKNKINGGIISKLSINKNLIYFIIIFTFLLLFYIFIHKIIYQVVVPNILLSNI